MFLMMVTGNALWLLYGILINDLPLIVANAVTLALDRHHSRRQNPLPLTGQRPAAGLFVKHFRRRFRGGPAPRPCAWFS